MSSEFKIKVKAEHLQKKAFLYVRQSTIRQVMENTESTRRQYDLRERAVALGWPREMIETIDTDLGLSGTSALDRQGFQKLVAEVGLGRAGIVMGLEVSRLARNCADWHRLIEISAMTRTLILDEDGIYDPTEFNDRLLLGLKGTMSEAETFLIKARLRGGLLNKARRGELRTILPIGLTYDVHGRISLDPDQQVQQSLRLVFETFLRLGTAHRVAKYFREKGLLFPRRTIGDPTNKVYWGPLLMRQVLQILHNPRYAGAYVFGRGHWKKKADGKKKWQLTSREQWDVFIPDAFTGYISWQQHEQIDQMIRNNALTYRINTHHGPAREGNALLQGHVLCGICGNGMHVQYHKRGMQLVPDYICNRNCVEHGEPSCQNISGSAVDEAVGELLVEAMTPITVEISLAIEQQVREKFAEADRLRHQQVERARYEVRCAQQRYMLVDPANRLVAGSLEAEYNEKLRELAEAEENYKRQHAADTAAIDKAQRKNLFSLAEKFPAIWRDPLTPMRERKRMLALLIEDVTLTKRDNISIQIRFKGGALKSLTVPLPLKAWQSLKTPDPVVALIAELSSAHTDGQIAKALNERGCVTGTGKKFSVSSVFWIRFSRGLKSYKENLQARGFLTPDEFAKRKGVSYSQVVCWRKRGLLAAVKCNDKGDWLYHLCEKDELNKKSNDGKILY